MKTITKFQRTMKPSELSAANPSFIPAIERLPQAPLTSEIAERARGAMQLIERKRESGQIITCASGEVPQYFDALRLIGATLFANRQSLSDDEQVVMITLDKSRQNMINYLLGRGLGGDAALKAAMECIKKATYETFNNNLVNGERPYILRYSEFSDEFTIILKARGITDEKIRMFSKNLRKAVESDFSSYEWSEPNGSGLLRTNLERASEIYKHPEIVATSTVSGIKAWKAGDIRSEDFLKSGLEETERAKLHYLGLLPSVYREVMPEGEMTSPFRMRLNGGVLPMGTVVEVKLMRNVSPEQYEQEARLLMKYIVRDFTDENGHVYRGTKKGLYEILANDMGRRLFNLVGNSRCNKIFISPVLEGAFEFGQMNDLLVVPSDDLNFLFIGAQLNDDLRVELARHISPKLSHGFRPRIKAIPTDGLTLNQLRPEFELMDIGMRGSVTHKALDDANFLINAIENIDPKVRAELFNGLGVYNIRNLVEVHGMFERIRTIRNVQDYTFVANTIGREELVSWLWNFVSGNAQIIRNRLRAFYTS